MSSRQVNTARCMHITNNTSFVRHQGVNIFSKRYIFVPIHSDLHWTLGVMCNIGNVSGEGGGPFIIHLDSLQGVGAHMVTTCST